MSVYDRIIEGFSNIITRDREVIEGSGIDKPQVKHHKGRRPLKMPKDYDFSVRNVDWKEYAKDFILRTDAVWEKSKLYDIFYAEYKSDLVFDNGNNQYMVYDHRAMPMPTNSFDDIEEWENFIGYTDIDGCVWQFRVGPKVQEATSLSRFVADKEGDSWYLCFLTFQKFMICNERSPVKVDEANLYNKGFWNYPCYEEVDQLFENCGADLFEPLYELYRVRLMSGNQKAPSYARAQTFVDGYGTFSDRKVLHY